MFDNTTACRYIGRMNHIRLFCCVLAVVLGVRLSSAGVTGPEEGRTTLECEDAFAALDRATLTEAYEKCGKKNALWDVQAVQFLTQAIRFHSPLEARVGWTDITNQAKALRQAECTDPMVRACLAMIEFRGSRDAAEFTRTRDELRAALAEMGEGGLPPYAKVMALDREWGMSWALKDEEGKARAIRAMIPVLMAGFSDAKATGDQERYLFRQVSGRLNQDWSIENIDRLEAAMEARKDLNGWPRHMLLGFIECKRAWDARGSGYAHTVTPEGWKAFDTHGRKAGEHFQAAYQLDPRRPEAATMMVRITMGGVAPEGQTVMLWAERATIAVIDHPATFDATLWALRPRWGGGYAEMLEMGKRWAASERYDTQRPYQLILAIRDVMEDADDKSAPFLHPGVYEAAVRVLTAQAKRGEGVNNPRFTSHWKSMHAALAVHADRHADARPLLEALNGQFDRSAAETFGDATWFDVDALAFSTPQAPLLRDAWSRIYTGDADTAAADARRALGGLDAALDPRGHRATASHANAIGLIAAARRGVTSVPLDQEASVWAAPRGGAWTAADGAWTYVGEGATDHVLVAAPVTDGTEWSARVKFAPGTSRGRAGLVFQWEWTQEKQARWRSVTVSPGTAGVTIANEFGENKPVQLPAPAESYVIRVVVWRGSAVATVNGEEVHRGELPKHPMWRPGMRVGLGATGRPGSVEFSDITLRILDKPPPGLE